MLKVMLLLVLELCPDTHVSITVFFIFLSCAGCGSWLESQKNHDISC